jgi:hypothetical protein
MNTDLPDNDTDRAARPATTPSPTFNAFAAVVSGVLVMGVGGAVVGCVMEGFDPGVGTLVGLGVGALLGLVAGRRVALSESVLGGMLAGAVLPVAVVLLGALRSGRLFDASPDELVAPQALLVFGGLAVAGAVAGSLLVLVRKMIVRLACGSPNRDTV